MCILAEQQLQTSRKCPFKSTTSLRTVYPRGIPPKTLALGALSYKMFETIIILGAVIEVFGNKTYRYLVKALRWLINSKCLWFWVSNWL